MKFKKSIICILSFLLVAGNIQAQITSDTTEKIIDIQTLSSKEAYYLVHRVSDEKKDSVSFINRNVQIELKYTNDDGKTFTLCNLDSVLSVLKGTLNTPTLNIHFVNKNLGFIYGYATVYAFYPILFRTEDGGKTWQTIIAGTTGTPLRRTDFFMFDEKNGIIVNNWGNEPNFNYMLTNDGGKTWKQHVFKISQKNIRILNEDGMLTESYNEDGQVSIIFTTPDSGRRGTSRVLMIQSNDFGKTFKELK